MTINNKYGGYWYQYEAQSKCRSTAKTVCKKVSLLKSYGEVQNILDHLIFVSYASGEIVGEDTTQQQRNACENPENSGHLVPP